MASQLVRPFDFQGAISDVTQAGATTFVDCGSPGWLAKIIVRAGNDRVEVVGPDLSETEVVDEPRGAAAPSPGRSDAVTAGKLRTNGTDGSYELGNGLVDQRFREGRVSPSVAIVGRGCILPGGASSPEQLFAAITEQRTGIVDQRRFDPNWEEDFYSADLVPDRSTSHLNGRIEDQEIVAPPGVDRGRIQSLLAGATSALHGVGALH